MRYLIEQARLAGAVPRVHGNGFIQFDLSPEVRLHIWGHPAIPRQAVPTPIHDHMFGFSSLILRGQLTNARYELEDGPATHALYRAVNRDREDTVLQPNGQTFRLRPAIITTYRMGETYAMEPGAIHESIATMPTATVVLKRGRLTTGTPAIYVPLNLTPDNVFHRYIDEDYLWSIIRSVMGPE